MRHRTTLGPALRSALAAHHLFDGVLDLTLKLFHTLVQAALAVLGAQLFHLLGRNTQQLAQYAHHLAAHTVTRVVVGKAAHLGACQRINRHALLTV